MRKIKFLVLLVLGGLIASCESDFLEPIPSSGITADSYYNTEEELLTGIIGMYDALQGVNDNNLRNEDKL